LSLAERRFNKIARLRSFMRYMNKERFDFLLTKLTNFAPDNRAGGGAPEMESRLSTLATCGFGVRTSLEATTG